jgi:23S rRNA (uracil1939-C5)-methyltransferase
MASKSKTYLVEIDKLVYGGDGMGRLEDGRAIFVPHVLPGEKVRVTITEEKKKFVRGSVVEITEKSNERIKPRCRHYGQCGGCHYQHLTYDNQLDIKTKIVTDQLERVGRFENPPVKPIIPSDREWAYRNNIQFHISENNRIGFQTSGKHEVVEIKECLLPEEPIADLWPKIDVELFPGLERLNIRVGIDEDLMLVLENSTIDLPSLTVDLPVSAVSISPFQTIVMAGDDHIVMEIKERLFKVSAGSFFQVNSNQAEVLVNLLLEKLDVDQNTVLMDLYAGVGLFSAFFAPKVKELIAIESAESSCEDFVTNLDAFDNVMLYTGPAEHILPGLEEKPDVMIVDPPRSGLHVKVLDAVKELHPKTLAYISCDPSTMARDAKRLVEAGYHLQEVTPVDLFPQTYHIETVSIFTSES